MSHLEHPRLRTIEPLALALDAAASTAIAAAKKSVRRRRRRPGHTLAPGPDTPVWNELAAECAAYLGKRGAEARLGRVLGLPRQRIHQLLVARSACPDAERTLLLAAWLARQHQGQDTL